MKPLAQDHVVFRQQNSDSFHKKSRFGFNRPCQNRYRPFLGKVISRLENHLLVSRHEPQFERSAINVNRCDRGINVPAPAAFATRGGSPDDRRDFSLINFGQ